MLPITNLPVVARRTIFASGYNASDVPVPYYDPDRAAPPWATSWATLWDADEYVPTSSPGQYYVDDYTRRPTNQPQIIIVPVPYGTPGVDDEEEDVPDAITPNPGDTYEPTPYPDYPDYPDTGNVNPYQPNYPTYPSYPYDYGYQEPLDTLPTYPDLSTQVDALTPEEEENPKSRMDAGTMGMLAFGTLAGIYGSKKYAEYKKKRAEKNNPQPSNSTPSGRPRPSGGSSTPSRRPSSPRPSGGGPAIIPVAHSIPVTPSIRPSTPTRRTPSAMPSRRPSLRPSRRRTTPSVRRPSIPPARHLGRL